MITPVLLMIDKVKLKLSRETLTLCERRELAVSMLPAVLWVVLRSTGSYQVRDCLLVLCLKETQWTSIHILIWSKARWLPTPSHVHSCSCVMKTWWRVRKESDKKGITLFAPVVDTAVWFQRWSKLKYLAIELIWRTWEEAHRQS